jgi:hypothetical protein
MTDDAEIVKLIAQRMRRLDPTLKPRLAKFQAEQLFADLSDDDARIRMAAKKLLTTITGAVAAGESNKTGKQNAAKAAPRAPKWELVEIDQQTEEKKAAT